MSVKFLLALAILVSANVRTLSAQDKGIPKDNYLASTIPDSLKENAHAVTRYSYLDITIKSPGHVAIKSHQIVTILDEKGYRESVFHVGFNKKYNTVSNAEMIVYGADAKLIKKYKKGDMYDHSAIDDETLFTDERILLAAHTIASYPVTIEMIYDEDLSSFLQNAWYVADADNVSVQNSTCKVTVNPEIGFRYKSENINVVPKKEKQDNMDVYTWTINNVKAEKPEQGCPPWLSAKKIVFTTDKFEYFGLDGNLDTWQNYGKWIAQLNADVDRLPPEREAEIRKMTDSIKDDKRKARFLYNYMQQNMRYVSVQLGLGGLKPFPAKFVDDKKYGDCKALVNYMYALLRAVNIPCYYSIVKAGINEEAADPAFPSDPFNHVILCVPFNNDTTWLECTNMKQPFGKLGPFTENRNALLITETGGKLVNTPRSNMADNRLDSYVHLSLQPDGGAKASVKFLSTGNYRDMYLALGAIKQDDQKKIMMRFLNIKQPISFDIKDGDDNGGTKETDIDLTYDRFFDIMSGDRQFYRPGVLDLWTSDLPETDKRKHDFYFESPMQKTCTTTIDLPEGFIIESLPADVNLKFSYGNYQSSYKYDAAKNQVTSVTKFNLNTHIIPAAKYTEMLTYTGAIAKAQNKKMVIRKKA